MISKPLLFLAAFLLASTAHATEAHDNTTIPQFEVQTASHGKLETRTLGLANNILCAWLGIGIFSNCQRSCPNGYAANQQGQCVPCDTGHGGNNPNQCGAGGNQVCRAPVNGAAACFNGQCGYYCPPNTQFNAATITCDYNQAPNPIGTVNNCAYQGNTCTSPFANSYPTCINGQGGYICSASCYQGYYWNPQTATCASGNGGGGQIGTVQNCAYVGNTCTTPFANSYPTCNPSGGGFACSAACSAGFYFDVSWNSCRPVATNTCGNQGVCPGGSICYNSQCIVICTANQVCANRGYKRGLTASH